MLSSLLSLYIASSIDTSSNLEASSTIIETNPIHNTTSQGFLTNLVLQINPKNSTKGPNKNPAMIAPIINAKAAIAIDLESGEILYEKNITTPLAIASVTKIMTNIIVLEENNIEEIATISAKAASQSGSRIGLKTGEQISLKNLIHGAMIQSGNDAATALAEYNAQSVQAFVDKMNQKAEQLELFNTHFKNPTGFDAAGHYSTAHDIAKLALYAYQNPQLREIIKIKEMDISAESGQIHHITNTNKLLDSYLNIKGFKTGTTSSAGECLVTVAENDSQNEIITVLLASPNRFQESKILIDWTFRAYNWK